MARCLVAFYNALESQGTSSLPCFYETFVDGLMKAGNEVLVQTTNIWNADLPKCPSTIAKKIKNFNPDVCFLFNNCYYDISDIVDCPIVIYEVDSFLFYSNKAVLYNNPNRFFYFVPQTSSFDILKQELHVDKSRIFHIPFFTEVHAKKEQIKNNICFCGSKFTNEHDNIIRKFLLLNPNQAEKDQFEKCLSMITTNPYITNNEIEKLIGVLSEKISCILQDPVLPSYLSDIRRISILTSVTKLGLTLRGTPNWINDLAYSNLPLSYESKKVYSLSDTEHLYNSHKIGININHIQATTGFGWRVADIMASNACLVSEYKPDFSKLFPNINLPFFESTDDAYDICKTLLENENMRADIVAQSQDIIEKKYRFKHILIMLEQILGMSLINQRDITNAMCGGG